MFPFMAFKKAWPLPPDVMYFDGWPVRQCSLLFAGLALSQPEYIQLWRTLNPDPTVEEIIRNYPIRQPLLWCNAGLGKRIRPRWSRPAEFLIETSRQRQGETEI